MITYWKLDGAYAGNTKLYNYANFNLQEGRVIYKGQSMNWIDLNAVKSRQRNKSITLDSQYIVQWYPYSKYETSEFKSLVMEII